MRYGKTKSIVLAGVILVHWAAPLSQCHAGPIIDWLFHRNASYAQPIYAPPTYAQPAATYVPTPTYGPAMNYAGGCDPCNQGCQRLTTNYAPDPYYRTTWVQMPVTNYRPVATVTAGYPATTLQPCTTYIWQARRLPSYEAFRPLYANYAPAPTAGCASCSVPASAPYYAPATPTSTFGPVTVSPGTTRPGIVGPSSTFAPTGGSAVPADMQPSLSPGGVPSSAPPTIRNFAPLDSVSPPLDPPSGLQLNSPAAMQKKPAKDDGLRFVPDPDAPAIQETPNRAPRLITPREKTAAASLRSNGASTPIPWSERPTIRPVSAETAVLDAPTSSNPYEEKWDDSGWRSLQQ